MLWVFGYGSLVWKPPAGAEANTRLFGYIEGYRRVWYQQSTDHRGTPDAPGRVVTLVRDDRPGARVWGVASLLSQSNDPSELQRICADLDFREKQYDSREQLDVFGADGSCLAKCAITYIGTPAGDNWGGERPLPEIAQIIATAHGPSGPNDEYLHRLCAAFREIGSDRAEPELFELEALVRAIQSQNKLS